MNEADAMTTTAGDAGEAALLAECERFLAAEAASRLFCDEDREDGQAIANEVLQ